LAHNRRDAVLPSISEFQVSFAQSKMNLVGQTGLYIDSTPEKSDNQKSVVN
jgi:hypothetical protein